MAKLCCHYYAPAPKPCAGKPAPGSIQTEASVSSRSLPRAHESGNGVLGKAARLPTQSLTPQSPNLKYRGEQSPSTLCLSQLAENGPKNVRQLAKPPRHYLQGLLGSAASGELHQSPSRTGCSGWARCPTLGEGTVFPCPSSKKNILKSL